MERSITAQTLERNNLKPVPCDIDGHRLYKVTIELNVENGLFSQDYGSEFRTSPIMKNIYEETKAPLLTLTIPPATDIIPMLGKIWPTTIEKIVALIAYHEPFHAYQDLNWGQGKFDTLGRDWFLLDRCETWRRYQEEEFTIWQELFDKNKVPVDLEKGETLELVLC